MNFFIKLSQTIQLTLASEFRLLLLLSLIIIFNNSQIIPVRDRIYEMKYIYNELNKECCSDVKSMGNMYIYSVSLQFTEGVPVGFNCKFTSVRLVSRTGELMID